MAMHKKISDVQSMVVYTDNGEYFGEVEETILGTNKVFGWRIKATRGSYLNRVLGGAKGVIVPHQLVKAIGDVMLISKAAVPDYEEPKPEGQLQPEF